MNDAPAPTEPAAAETATPAETAAAGLETLAADKAWQADFNGDNGRPAQIAAVKLKADTHRAAFHREDTTDSSTELSAQIEDGLAAPDAISQAAAEAMIPGQSPEDYKFAWADAATTDMETMQEQTAIASQAAFDVGASPEYARSTVRALEDMIASSSGNPPSMEQLTEALTRQFGTQADATVEAAKASLAKMSPEAREWAINAAGALDASGAAWFTGRLASVHRANK